MIVDGRKTLYDIYMKTKFIVVKDDITKLEVDAIVNAANETLLGGGGVDGAIHFAAGPELLAECKTLGGCHTGEAKMTKGYNLRAKFVIHTVGPVYGEENGREEILLQSCYESSLILAKGKGLRTIAFPCISTGIFAFPKDEAAEIALRTVNNFVHEYPEAFEAIIFVTFSKSDLKTYKERLSKIA